MLLACVEVFFGFACERADPRFYGTTRPKHGADEVWYCLVSEPEWLDPSKASDSASGTVITNVFEGLLQANPKTLEPVPGVAHGWEVFDGGRRYRFHLRDSQWSDGVPVTAHDFEFAWKRLLNPKTASRYATFLYPVRYGEEAHRRALRISGLTAQVTEAQVRAFVGGQSDIEKVVMAPEQRSAFVHLQAPEGQTGVEHTRGVITRLKGRALAGRPVRVSMTDVSVVGVKALSDHILEVTLTDPLPYFLSIVSFYSTMPLPRHLFKRLEAEGIPQPLWTRPEHIVSNGPYRLSEWAFRQYIVLEKNPRYWDAEHVRIRKVRLPMVESYNTVLNLYKAGELDHIGEAALPSEFMDHLEGFQDFRRANYLATYFLWVNTGAPPLDNPLVREALSLSIDRESLVKYVARGGQIPTRDMVPGGVGGYRSLGRKLFDPEAARAALTKAGYGPGNPLPPITYRYNTAEAHKQIAEAVQQMWKEHLGIEVGIENQEWKVYLKQLEAHEFQLARLGWIGDYADANTFLEILRSTSGNNHSNWRSPTFDGMLDRANGTLDRAHRLELLREAEAFAMQHNPVIPMYVYTRSELIKPYLRGAYLNYQTRTYFKYMWIDERYYDGTPEPLPDGLPRVPKPILPGGSGSPELPRAPKPILPAGSGSPSASGPDGGATRGPDAGRSSLGESRP
ncbi:MAG: ABC transporter substrate-binding protein [Myxococcales bacterium]|nr:ABC transporter substrate-binding protein [Myxococcales bacterium]